MSKKAIVITAAVYVEVSENSKSDVESLARAYQGFVEDALRGTKVKVETTIYEVG